MSREYEVLRQLFRVVERRDNTIYKTQYVRNIWVRVAQLGQLPTPPPDHIFVSMPMSFNGPTIRRPPKEANSQS